MKSPVQRQGERTFADKLVGFWSVGGGISEEKLNSGGKPFFFVALRDVQRKPHAGQRRRATRKVTINGVDVHIFHVSEYL